MVRLEQAAEHLLALDLADRAVHRRWNHFASVDAGRDSIADSLVRPVSVVETAKCPHGTAQALEAGEDRGVQSLGLLDIPGLSHYHWFTSWGP